MAAHARPSDAQIRRALAECMTVDDIDDAMGWPRGTARRRRWTAPDHGGLPFADAELAGVALWFRSTFELWQQTPAAHAGRRQRRRGQDAGRQQSDVPRSGHEDSSAPADDPDSAEGAPEVGHAGVEELDEQDDQDAEAPPAEAAAEADDRAEGGGEVLRVPSGLDLSLGQVVLADIGGRWLEARVNSREHGTVLVEYQLDDTPLGARVRRLGIDRVRVLSPEQSEG